MRVSRIAGGVVGAVLSLAVFSLAVGSEAAEDPTFRPSLASPLVQSKAQIRIFALDDASDGACKLRKFVAVEVVTQPTVVQLAANVRQKKWQEHWTVDRCGKPIGYRVFFTDLGDGGAYFSYVEMPTQRAEDAVVTKAATSQ